MDVCLCFAFISAYKPLAAHDPLVCLPDQPTLLILPIRDTNETRASIMEIHEIPRLQRVRYARTAGWLLIRAYFENHLQVALFQSYVLPNKVLGDQVMYYLSSIPKQKKNYDSSLVIYEANKLKH